MNLHALNKLPFLLLLWFLFPVSLHATHIVGGEMNYTCLGNNEYEISLTIFRDCYNGDPRAWFDDPASIGIFNADHELIFEIQIPLMGNDTLAPVLSSECLVAPPDVCVHTTTYRAIVELPPIIGGYQLAYQRCCRNQTIANIVDPLATGATFGVTISERALLECNSNPKFKEWPPIYICAGEPIFFDQSAIDIDGDSIVYRLCTPLAGANQQFPQPQPPNPPPYREIVWQDPPYSVDNMLNGFPGAAPLQIDSQTGLLTGLPNTIGQFVVGICVEEYRNGALISTTRRDFQYNVGQCARTVAAFFAPEVYCDGLTATFENQSEESETFLWSFRQNGEELERSLERSPTYTFPDTGLYTVSLIANPDGICSDTFVREIQIRYPSLAVDFDWQRPDCSDSVRITARDQSTDSLSTIVRRRWTLNPGGYVSEAVEPEFRAPAANNYYLRLEVETANGCRQSREIEIPAAVIKTSLNGDSLLVCRGDSVRLNPGFDPGYQYQWEINEGIGDPTEPNPLIFPDGSATFIVRILDTLSLCEVSRRVPVFVPQPLELSVPSDTTLCVTEWPLVALSSGAAASIVWAGDPDFTEFIAEGDTAWVSPRGREDYFVTATDRFGCTETDSVRLQGNGIELEIPQPPSLCLGREFQLLAVAADTTDVVAWSWRMEGGTISGANTAQPLIVSREAGRQNIELTVSNQFGCRREENIPVFVLDTIPAELVIDIQQCNDYLVQFSTDHPLAPGFVWQFGDGSQPGASVAGAEVRHRYPGPGSYELTITLGAETVCPDTLRRLIQVNETDRPPAIDYELLACADTALVRLQDASGTPPAALVSRRWHIDGSTVNDSSAFDWPVYDTDSLLIQLILTQTNGCTDTLEERIAFPVLDIALPDTLRACPDDLVSLNPGPTRPYFYRWSPGVALPDSTAPDPRVMADTSAFYRLSVSDSTGQCGLELGVQLWVAPRYQFALPPDTTICETVFTIKSAMTAEGLVSWSTRPDFQTLAGQGPGLTVNVLEGERWYARATDFFGCSQVDSIEIITHAVQLELTPEQTLCIGDTLAIRATSVNDQALIYDWGPAASILDGVGTDKIWVSPSTDTEYQLSVTNEFGCRLDTSVLVRIFNYVPPLSIAAYPDTLFAPGEVLLKATMDETYVYQWSPVAGLSDPVGATTLVFVEETHTFDLVVRDGNGCINRAALTVVVYNPDCVEPNIFVPTAFTPNGDNINDIFLPRGLNIEELYLIIYNRWGEKVFQSNEPDRGWDGTYLGEQLGPDVYGFYLEVGCANGQRFEKKGNVTLLR